MPDRHRPRVSVVIPFQDRAQFLDDAVTSCLEAYSGPLEMVPLQFPRPARLLVAGHPGSARSARHAAAVVRRAAEQVTWPSG